MVEVRYKGRLGNNLFQYCFGRVLAENLGFKLKADFIPGFPNTKKNIDGYDYSSFPAQLLQGQEINLESILHDKTKRKIIVDGYFQRYEYYKEYKDSIRNDWLLTGIEIKDQIKTDDIVVVIRRGADYIPKHALPLSYYEEALSKTSYDRIFICTDSTSDKFIQQFKKKYKAIVRPTDPLDNLGFIMRFNKIIISNSSFAGGHHFYLMLRKSTRRFL